MALARWVGRAIGLDVHRDFCVVAICEDGVTRSAGRVPSTPEGIRTLAESLLPTDRVALEVTGSCWEVARILEPHVQRVVVVSPEDTGISSARAKTDKSAWTAAHPGAMKCSLHGLAGGPTSSLG
jgi:transposase